MALLSSKTLIQAHALFTFILSVYLVISPNAITDSDIIFIIGEAMQIDLDPAMTTFQYPLAICAILLTGEALVDLIIVRKLPQIDDILSTVQHEQRRTEDTGFSRITLQKPKQNINALTIQLATLYNEIWTFIACVRFCFFFAVSLFIYTSGGNAGKASLEWSDDDAGQIKLGLEQVKSRVVFTYAFVEMMFWLWTLSNVREERREVATRLAQQQAAENERNLKL
ncbi:hypothetical protein TMatcc_001619 [Talaromyces marneffei ATCC 18224]|uniref:Increased loss of mitochondrial DNA protein 1 n=1 Tax=Talaromyces marneffei (strain ATCC 18224 / CBS 334.59 / QM 7333) TaxID=441960 RepID=B6QHB7_TALMQ|nr:uncharacterized protein EYB26_007172 [Talaromyces marneffei]EEA22762.1 conserved hypothetical protein [Talaromyces marneffei ATCC 18224]KAE8551646.1 hypothetical protein EYB25_005536 [Talaromyces marneffei]QGA19483.1 hypothetical protein EYB26_007172 [Talaromyces marneffei]